ncbi:MAG TPA: lipid-A-disaccharide synthase N-terminal domain-containing protein [Thermoanaerobaculia bacterium]|jgi:lipid-A-disaccharide synthase-like uncharacterized protein
MKWDLWLAFGLLGQLLFGSRFIVQWISSERRKASHIPVMFWYLSLSGGIVTTVYAIHRRDPVFIIGQGAGLIVYVRNLMLINRAQSSATPAAPADRA